MAAAPRDGTPTGLVTGRAIERGRHVIDTLVEGSQLGIRANFSMSSEGAGRCRDHQKRVGREHLRAAGYDLERCHRLNNQEEA